MFNGTRTAIATLATAVACTFTQPAANLVSIDDLKQPIQQQTVEITIEEDFTSSPPAVVDMAEPEEPIEYIIPVVEEPKLSESEIELIALVTMAEAEGESEKGKRLVISTILNRVDSDLRYFPDTVTEVIYQPAQFSSMWNGRVDRCYVDEDICELVREELILRTNNDVLYFHADRYGKYGTPMFSEGNHYFSG